MAEYLIDTNHLSAAILPVSRLRDRFVQAIRSGHRLGTCIPVLCELEAGIQNSRHLTAYRRQLARLLNQVRLWPLDVAVGRAYGGIYLETIKTGRVLSQVDMMLAAMVRERRLILLTADKDFETLNDVPTEDWL